MTTNDEAPTEEQMAKMTVEELEQYADEFTWDDAEEVVVETPSKLDAAISVRFNSDELDELRELAKKSGKKVTALIRETTLRHARDPKPTPDMEAVQAAVWVLFSQLAAPELRHDRVAAEAANLLTARCTHRWPVSLGAISYAASPRPWSPFNPSIESSPRESSRSEV